MSGQARLQFSAHAIQQMYARDIAETEIREALETGEVIEEHATVTSCPSRLILASVGGRALHVVAAYPAAGTITVITAYEPDTARWKPGFRERRQR